MVAQFDIDQKEFALRRRELLCGLGALAVAGCNSSSSSPKQPSPGPAATSQPVPTAPVQSPAPISPQQIHLNAARSKLSHWFAGDLDGKTIAWVGDSTTYLMDEQAKGGLPGLNEHFLRSYVDPADGPLHGTKSTWMGSNGNYLAHFNNNSPWWWVGLSATIDLRADLYIFSYGINDVREGRTGQEELTRGIRTAVNSIRSALPNSDVVLWTPNSFLTTDPTGYGFVQPNAQAQAYTDILRNSYRVLADEWPNVALLDSQIEIFGANCQPTSPLMRDQIHPNFEGYTQLMSNLVKLVGR